MRAVGAATAPTAPTANATATGLRSFLSQHTAPHGGTRNEALQLVRFADNKVITTATYHRAYVVKVTNTNGWGGCAAHDGKILLGRLELA
ncbi:hypothetical protein AB0368_37235 [Actinoplanes sp. NPDC051475]|uniref:hypothetical protein n=1 Tax=Actinoplanes sp. NPDC051475 TaxID=3157225 RepID=UPI00344BE8DA